MRTPFRAIAANEESVTATSAREGSVAGGSLSHHRIIASCLMPRNRRAEGHAARHSGILYEARESGT